MPEQNTAPSASSQEWPIPLTTPKVKKALRPMPGAHRDRPVRPQAHDRGADEGGQNRGCENRAEIHAGVFENQRVDHDDVGHREECRDAGNNLTPHRGSILFKLELSVKEIQ